MAVDDVGDLPLERPDGFLLGLALSHLLVEVRPPLGVGLSDLANGRHVDGVVELPIAPSGQPVGHPSSGGDFDGSSLMETFGCNGVPGVGLDHSLQGVASGPRAIAHFALAQSSSSSFCSIDSTFRWIRPLGSAGRWSSFITTETRGAA